jgi:hypothetical protein
LSPSEKVISIIIGLGLVLYPIHSKSLTFGSSSETFLFLPWIGFGLILIGLICLFDNKWGEFKKYIGPKVIWIPLLVIVGSAFARIAIDPSAKTFASAGLFAIMFALYVGARKLGVKILWAFLPVVVIEAISCIIQGLVDHGYRAGGIVTSFRDIHHTANYDIATCWLILGTCLFLGFNKGIKLRYLVLVAAALYFVAAEEALVALVCLGITAIIRKDISKKVVPIAIVLALCLSVGAVFGTTQDLYNETRYKVESLVTNNVVDKDNPLYEGYTDPLDRATTGRVGVYKDTIENTSLLGHGYTGTDFSTATPHNLWLICLNDLGILAALSLLFLTIYCFWKSTWKYVWVAFLSLAVFDHYLFTQVFPWTIVLFALSMTIPIEDKIFNRGGNDGNKERNPKT